MMVVYSVLLAVGTFTAYWAAPTKWRNAILLLGSYSLYAFIDARFLLLLLCLSVLDFYLSRNIYDSRDVLERRALFIFGLCLSVVPWIFFKYFSVFITSFFPGAHIPFNVILPLGISFYTFHRLSYLIDIYKGKIVPPSIADYLLYIGYFPKLISGPIERANVFVEKLNVPKKINEIDWRQSLYLIIWGLFKKFVISGSLVVVITQILSIKEYSITQILLLSYLVLLNIYADFSGYTDIVRGISKLFCIDLSMNFNFPFFSKNPLEFFQRWHITLMTWMRDYIYTPLFIYFSSKTPIRYINGARWRFGLAAFFALFVTFFVFGLWHGEMNYLLLGILAFLVVCIFIVFEHFAKALFVSRGAFNGKVMSSIRMALNFHVIAFIFLIPLVPTGEIMSFIGASLRHTGVWTFKYISLQILLLVGFFIIYECVQYIRKDSLFMIKKGFIVHVMFYLVLFFLFINTGEVQNTGFIYFQF